MEVVIGDGDLEFCMHEVPTTYVDGDVYKTKPPEIRTPL